MLHKIPAADVLLHAGDFTGMGSYDQVMEFNSFLETLNDRIKYKVVIAGLYSFQFINLIEIFLKYQLNYR